MDINVDIDVVENMLLISNWAGYNGIEFDDEKIAFEFCKKIYIKWIASGYDYVTEYLANEGDDIIKNNF